MYAFFLIGNKYFPIKILGEYIRKRKSNDKQHGTFCTTTIVRKKRGKITALLHKIHYSIEVLKKTPTKNDYWFSKYNRILHHYSVT
jgi:hypothetical protein